MQNLSQCLAIYGIFCSKVLEEDKYRKYCPKFIDYAALFVLLIHVLQVYRRLRREEITQRGH